MWGTPNEIGYNYWLSDIPIHRLRFYSLLNEAKPSGQAGAKRSRSRQTPQVER